MVRLDKRAIDRALPLVNEGLKKYCWLQATLAIADVARDREFQIKFNGFYRVRLNASWQSAYYAIFQQEIIGPTSYAGVLRALHAATGRVEASFASKLTASVDPGKPVIDSVVLRNLGLRLSRNGAGEERLERVVELHDRIGRDFSDYLDSDMGRYLLTRFEKVYPNRQLTDVMMLDLILWQTR